MLKITRAPNLKQLDLCYLELDGRKVGTVYAFAGCYDRIREAIEEREATPEEGYLLEEKTRRLENADALREIEEIAADGNLKAFRQICDIANAALRSELDALTPCLAKHSLYSDEGRKVASRIEWLERRIAWLEREILRNEGQTNLFEEA